MMKNVMKKVSWNFKWEDEVAKEIMLAHEISKQWPDVMQVVEDLDISWLKHINRTLLFYIPELT